MVGPTHRLVIARNDEDLSWTQRVDRKRWHITVIKKGQQVPNAGREASSYLYAMSEVCYDDDGWVCFVQGDPFDHYPALIEVLNGGVLPMQLVPLGKDWYESDEEGGPWHPVSLPVKEWYEEYIGKWRESIRFAPGAQFVTPAALIRSRTQDELRALRERVETTPGGAWTMERLWLPYFTW